MDISKLTHGAKVILIAGIVFLVTSFFNWFEITDTSFGENMWHGIGFLAGLLLIALVVWQAIRLANIDLEIGVTPSMITAALAVLLVLFTFIRFISKPGGGIADSIVDRTIWAWIGLILSIVIAVGAWLNMKAARRGPRRRARQGAVADRRQLRRWGGRGRSPAADTASTPAASAAGRARRIDAGCAALRPPLEPARRRLRPRPRHPRRRRRLRPTQAASSRLRRRPERGRRLLPASAGAGAGPYPPRYTDRHGRERPRGRDRDDARQERARRDAQGRRDHGRRQRRAGADRRERRRRAP